MCARLGLTAGFIGTFLLGVFVVHPKIVFAVFDFMAERPLRDYTHTCTQSHAPTDRCYPVTPHARAHKLINPHAHTPRATLRRFIARRMSL
jgi:hypothetical protein